MTEQDSQALQGHHQDLRAGMLVGGVVTVVCGCSWDPSPNNKSSTGPPEWYTPMKNLNSSRNTCQSLANRSS